MIYIILVLLIFATIILGGRLISYRNELVRLSKKLNDIDLLNSNEKLNIEIKSKSLYNFLLEINRVIETFKSGILSAQLREREVKHIITNLSHDLRTPLTSLSGYLQLLEKEETSESQKQEYLLIVNKKVVLLKNLLDELFEFSLIDGDEYETHLEKTDINSVLGDALSNYYEDISKQFKEPEIKVSQVPIFILADKKYLKRVFGNLIENAIKYGDDKLKIAAIEEDGTVKVTFSNTVTGLREDDAPKLLERFFRMEYSRTTQGSGLGLNIARKLVKDMKGEMKIFVENSNMNDYWLTIDIIFHIM